MPLLGIKGERAGQQFVKYDPERIDVGTGIQVMDAGIGLFRTHIDRSSDEGPGLSEHSFAGGLRPNGFRQAEVDNTWSGFAIYFDHQDVGRFQIAMNDRLLMRVQHAIADSYEKFQAIADFELMLIAVGGDRNALYVLHHKIRLAVGSGPSVEDFGDCRVVHDRERLAFRLKALQHGLIVNSGADQFEG